MELLQTSCKSEHHHQNPKSPESPPTSITTTATATAISTPTCCKCGAPTPMAAPPPSFSDISPPPNYRPIRAPAINLPPNSNSQQAIILAPVPQPLSVPQISPPFHFQLPNKVIQSPDDLRRFHDSFSGKHFVGFIAALSESIRAKKISDPCHQSDVVNTIVSILETLIQWVDEIPPTQQAARYGNVSFRSWHERLSETSHSLMLQFLPEHLHPSTIEIVPYFTDSFGNQTRIDYGTGHETNFAAWLYCLARMGVIKEEDYPAVVARVFFVKKVKKGPFSEHSPLLDDISGVPNWNKVNSGLLKMYKAEVLGKVPIMQHFLFGWLIKWYDPCPFPSL
ncbi:hypothetical protein C1H46_014461 [Malus baccata]|uniref:Serine/threonine-protein phosphatase 2A activator n=1 Tax=Malus baccata TaxID=106549 RepID=A0A540MME6_MALBA|nr:hypothetical protein C1H46_014461 [Malus baccata]